ncbi:hypothetical protein CAPTEDRAFT_194913 [Capitella teleta]|uniref:DDE Tnp4 domain-containing protein n=1 Tax=Capitella teleta TaxID=283909 RepID=R7TUQ8_CAPTE|nr:hypothetical protein CAPTEDRAFT_194913 [Capitella teleta]|eukprot:ELT97424.1 hypothetical protein CAPTEDRAFT_194913 [Capitella teleta]
MADVSFSAGSDEECEILVGMVHDRLPREYAHQPIRIVESETSDENHSTTASEEESTAEEATENRLASVNTWCRCGMCESETLGDEKEAICCLEVPNCVKMIAAGIQGCMLQHPQQICSLIRTEPEDAIMKIRSLPPPGMHSSMKRLRSGCAMPRREAVESISGGFHAYSVNVAKCYVYLESYYDWTTTGCCKMAESLIRYHSDHFWFSYDKENTSPRGCTLLRQAEPGDAIMADKGFNVQDLFESSNVVINIPTFSKRKIG